MVLWLISMLKASHQLATDRVWFECLIFEFFEKIQKWDTQINAHWWDAFNILMSHSTIDWYCILTSIVAPSAAVTLQAFYLWLCHWLYLAVKFALLRISTSLYKITMTTNPLLDDIRYKEGLVCMNKGMFEGAIDLFCSLAEEWWVDAISAQSINNGIYWFYCACCTKWLWCKILVSTQPSSVNTRP